MIIRVILAACLLLTYTPAIAAPPREIYGAIESLKKHPKKFTKRAPVVAPQQTPKKTKAVPMGSDVLNDQIDPETAIVPRAAPRVEKGQSGDVPTSSVQTPYGGLMYFEPSDLPKVRPNNWLLID
ncbi:hypothetical protein HY970_02880 [Candidatus Kaiserbacteria bacterium]|nr:hypothetical protein [Candidatus Kaiserbacteria bacterium]